MNKEQVINGMADKIEILESKYYNLRSELDGIYKVLEMDALDIESLQANLYKDALDIRKLQEKIFNKTMQEGHETIKRVKNNTINNLTKNDINKLVNEVLGAEYEAEQMLIDENNKLNEEE